MSSTALRGPARTILRSRLRRHSALTSIVKDGNIATLTVADLVQTAMLLGLSVPTDLECEAYNQAKAKGAGTKDCLLAADAACTSSLSGVASLTASGGQDVQDNEDPADAEVTDAPAPALSDEDAAKAEIEAKAKAEVQRIMGMFTAGDFPGFQSGLTQLAIDALKPAEIQVITQPAPYAIDPAKVRGHIAQVTGKMKAAALTASVVSGMDPARIALDVYDAPNAPRKDANYLWPDCTAPVVAQLARGRHVFLYGPAGTGKTSFAKQLAAHAGREYIRISCTETTEAETLVGMTVPDAAGGVKWQDGQLSAAIRKPGAVIHIDEFTAARPGALFVLQSLLDEERALHVAETGEYIPTAPGVVFILTDNTNGTGDTTGQYEATRVMNRALLDRFGATFQLSYMGQAEETKALVSRAGCKPKLAAMLTKFAAVTRGKADQGHVSHGLTLRRLISLAELITDGMEPTRAFQVSVIEGAPHDDREPLRQLWTAEMNAVALANAR